VDGFRRPQFLSLPLLVAALAATPACKVRYRHEVEPPGTPANYTISAGGFMRYDGYDDVAGDLEIASRDYAKPGSPVRVRLTGVIHIGDADYYRTLQKELLDPADVVLFEGVKYEGLTPPDLGGAYKAVSAFIGTSFQKDEIDYKAKNFVHCDVTVRPGDPLAKLFEPEALPQAQEALAMLATLKSALAPGKRGREVEDAIKHNMVAAMAAQMGAEPEEGADDAIERELEGKSNLPEALRERVKEAVKELKKAAPMLPELPGMDSAIMKEILEKRNAYVLERLRERLDAAKDGDPQTIAIFYGAAHMPGIEKQLRAWGYEPIETVWLKAWRINSAGGPIVAERRAEKPLGGSLAPAREPARPAGPERPRKPRREPVLY
jgi:hypothetical protein